jgi:hypothetical protein
MSYDELLPVSLHRANNGEYLLLDCHNDELAMFQPMLEIEDMERLVTLINNGILLDWLEKNVRAYGRPIRLALATRYSRDRRARYPSNQQKQRCVKPFSQLSNNKEKGRSENR